MHTHQALRSARAVANLLDNQFGIGKFRFGIDAIIGLIPISGDTLVLLLSLYPVMLAFHLGVPKGKIGTMVGNLVAAYVVGILPIAGDLAYAAMKPNLRNLAILEGHLEERNRRIA